MFDSHRRLSSCLTVFKAQHVNNAHHYEGRGLALVANQTADLYSALCTGKTVEFSLLIHNLNKINTLLSYIGPQTNYTYARID